MMDTYYKKEDWHDTRLTHKQAAIYFSRAIATKNIVFEQVDGKIVGYLEIWRLDKDQLARIINDDNIDVLNENLTRGEFVFVNNMYVDEQYRGRSIARRIKRVMENINANYPYLGVIMRDLKYNRRLRIMKRKSMGVKKYNNVSNRLGEVK